MPQPKKWSLHRVWRMMNGRMDEWILRNECSMMGQKMLPPDTTFSAKRAKIKLTVTMEQSKLLMTVKNHLTIVNPKAKIILFS